MSFVSRHVVPLAAALGAAAAAFAVVALTTDQQGPATDGGPTPAAVARGSSDGLAVFTRLGCGGCHELAAAGSSGPIGPDLDDRLRSHTRESLTAAILRPPAGSAMPPGFGARMNKAEFGALLDFLLAQREPR
jgi:mono/diheme cytochrome c family protein